MSIYDRIEKLQGLSDKTDLEAQIAFMEAQPDMWPVGEAILKSLKKLKSMLPAETDAIVPEMDTFDPTQGKCTGKCNIVGVSLSQCTECGWDETHSQKS